MKKSLLFAAGFAALAMLFAACDDGGNSKKPGSEPPSPPSPPPAPEGWYIKVDSDPAKFAVSDSQAKFQFQITDFSYTLNSEITFSFMPCETCAGSVTFRDSVGGTKWFYNQKLPAEVGEVVTGLVQGCTITKTDDKWYECTIVPTADGRAVGCTFILPNDPDGSEVAYFKDFVITGVDAETQEPFEWIYSEEDFAVDGDEVTDGKVKFEKYVVSEGIRAQIVPAF